MIAHSVDDPLYYLHNFRQVLRWVESRYTDLLDAQELAFVQAFAALAQPAQALMVRMVMRKGELFRCDRLDYAEIGDTAAALQPLLALGWVREPEVLSLEQLFALLRKDELALGFAGQLARPRAAKGDLLEQLRPLSLAPRPLHEWFAQAPVSIVQWCLQPLCDRIRLLFFGNLYQDWSDFVLADLGLLRFEQVPFSRDSRALQQRSEVDQAMALHQCGERLELGEEPASILATLAGLTIDNPWLARRHGRLLFAVGQQCERLGDWDQALAVYARSSHAQARIRQVRVFERSERWEQAHALARQLAAEPANTLEVQALERMLPRLARKLGGPAQPRRRAAVPELIELELPREQAALGVEEAVRQYLGQTGGQAHYVENTLFNSLFGLLCWEAIFAPVPGAFFNPFQAAPQDLHDSDFQQRRAVQLAACLGRLDDGSHRQAILDCYAAKQGLQSPFVFWSMLNEGLLDQALTCLPAAHLKQCFLRLLQDIRNNRAGMPDLIQFWPEQQRYRMVEVKGPGDRLQDNQLRWLEFCAEHGLPVAVCHVRWSEPA
ncbi:TPA: VRR-NUC domain-containing protein [Pseudomonas putida]|uniref:VRR-NUC domain-containing protein n=1 Tax=Pseudomonas TaxID=286 RepID=UPI000486836E|nr:MULTISPECIES: VRR-NUC domain-containing protein [Pseudomonas]MDD2152426.1 VRR-NUC domain-containing protein [Pseudomonas putida]RAS22253.1 VRR-NUC domain-containing protein [Pseudomonas sp. URMO17WK12:I7]SMF60446.1 VRR-NUC domain-containing protein [Pseudomonas sp. URMO17WK12:I5]HDS1679345.1 VRR-NUC domain-containing protein [Pseudomonas putida]